MEKKYHPWQQSIREALYLLTLYGKEGDLVLDPFVGSGTNLLAAKLKGMRFMGYELNEKTYLVAVRRIEQTPIGECVDLGRVPLRGKAPEGRRTRQVKLGR
jgi:site-specific DNA-methyltransferase (adenine-specific)